MSTSTPPPSPDHSIAAAIARQTDAQNLVAFLHGFIDGGAECYGIDQRMCAEIRDALAAWMNTNWEHPQPNTENKS